MNLKKLFVASSLAFAAMSASAVPLDTLAGNITIKLTGLTTETRTTPATGAGYAESTWGVGAITQMYNTNGDIWNAGSSDGTYLYYMLYGVADMNIITNPDGTFSIFNVGATTGVGADGKIHLDVYRSNTLLPQLIGGYNANPAGRTGYGSYSLLDTLGPAYLELTFGTGKVALDLAGGTDPTADERETTLYQRASAVSLPTSGSGNFFADVVGGTAATQWDTNGQAGHDFDGAFTLAPNGVSTVKDPITGATTTVTHGTCSAAQVSAGTCFAGFINDPITATKVPEPGSLALLGLGMAGLAGLRRRKNKA